MIKEVRFYGRGGQGIVTASRILAEALFREGKNVQAFPFFGIERRGAPVFAFLRYGDEIISSRTYVQNPDIVVIFDESLLDDGKALAGLKDNGMVIINTKKISNEISVRAGKIAIVDANSISLRNLGRPIVNTVMCGAFAFATHDVSVEKLSESLECFFNEKDKIENNRRALIEGYHHTEVYLEDRTNRVSTS